MSISHTDNFKDEDICCICMETKSNLILSCTHNFCEKCIKEWQISNKSCPICRCFAGENDGFILADKPDYYRIQDEISKSLFEITENPSVRHCKNKKALINESDSDEDD
jgi:hypothetical protein